MKRSNFVLAPKRRRRPVTKSSLGCAECKSRKIKCDETRPTCLKCRRRGNICSGVATGLNIRWSTKHENFHHQQLQSRKDSVMNNPFRDICSTPESAQNNASEAAPAEIESPSKENDESTTIDESQIHETECTGPSPENTITSERTQVSESSAVTDLPQLHFPVGCTSDAQLAFAQAASHEEFRSQSDKSPAIELNYLSHFEKEIFLDLLSLEQEQSFWEGVISPISRFDESESPDAPSPPKTHDQTSANENYQTKLETGGFESVMKCQSELITIYFTIVCPIFSTFDSEHNLFRSFVSSKWQHSATLFYSILSMAAAKLSRGLPDMKRKALEYQNQAIVNLQADVSRASCWNDELLFAILMLGLSTSWHVVTDLGIPHLRALQQAVSGPSFQHTCNLQILRFVKQALVYWEMVICSVDDDVIAHDDLISDISEIASSSENDSGTIPPRPETFQKPSSIMPHPWAGVAVAPQALFAQVCHRIRQARSYRHIASTHDYVNDGSNNFLEDLDKLEKQIWLLKLPALHEIANTGDKNTPAIHHLLLAEAYMFATMYQLYRIFPRLRKHRLGLLQRVSLDKSLAQDSWAFDQARSWPLSTWDRENWVEFLGLNTILRLEQIQETSGTCCVHALLLLVGSGSLVVSPELELDSQQVYRTRRFVLDRLSQVSASKLSEPISLVELVVMEIFRRLDLGLDVFWMDAMDAMGVITVIG